MDEQGNFLLENALAEATVRFYLEDLVEIMITMKADNAVKYYLHFQLQDLKEGARLFYEMVEAFSEIEEHKKVRVLLCCTSGCTTGFFAGLLNKAAEALSLNYEFDAAAYWRLYEAAVDFDVILMAPQIAYKYEKVKNSLPKKLVLMAPTALFSSNDTYKTLQYLDGELAAFKESLEEDMNPGKLIQKTNLNGSNVLCIGVIYGSESVRTYYQVWNGNRTIAQDSMKRPIKFGIVLKEVIQTVISRIPLDLIVIGLLGIISENRYWQSLVTGEYVDFKKELEEQYNVTVWLLNNANATVLGLRQEFPGAHTLMFHSQPYAHPYGGQAFMIGDLLIEGRQGLSGEPVNYLERMQFSNAPSLLAKTDAGMLEIVTKALLPAICLLGPDLIVLRSPMTSGMNEVRLKLESLINPRYVPRLVYIDNMHDYLLAGVKKRSEQYLNSTQKNLLA